MFCLSSSLVLSTGNVHLCVIHTFPMALVTCMYVECFNSYKEYVKKQIIKDPCVTWSRACLFLLVVSTFVDTLHKIYHPQAASGQPLQYPFGAVINTVIFTNHISLPK